ncbi:hypothetical protein BGX33_008871 [Mortierella sp. NVP41]|nr:hypothetical protein BGX33_008871 [Mortierella sp. NVP41]
MSVTGFSVAPYPLCIGKEMCFTVIGSLNTPIFEPVRLSITGKYLNRVVYTDNHDYCQLLAAMGRPCPVAATVTVLTTCVLVKPTIPAYVNMPMQFLVLNGDNNVIYCQAGG